MKTYNVLTPDVGALLSRGDLVRQLGVWDIEEAKSVNGRTLLKVHYADIKDCGGETKAMEVVNATFAGRTVANQPMTFLLHGFLWARAKRPITSPRDHGQTWYKTHEDGSQTTLLYQV